MMNSSIFRYLCQCVNQVYDDADSIHWQNNSHHSSTTVASRWSHLFLHLRCSTHSWVWTPLQQSTTHLCSIVHFWVWTPHNSQQHISVAVCIPGCGPPNKSQQQPSVSSSPLQHAFLRVDPPTSQQHISVALCISGCEPPTTVNNTFL